MDLPINYKKLTWQSRLLVRLEYIRLQDGLCCYCNQPLDGNPPDEIMDIYIDRRLFPDNFFRYPVHLHHNHETGMTIGAIHNRCNAVLWQYHHE